MLRREDYLIRPLEEADLPRVLVWRNSLRIRKVMFSEGLITMDMHQSWFKKVKQDPRGSYNIFEFMGNPAGVVNITEMDQTNKVCSWGFYLGEENLPKGTGLVMGRLALELAFEKLAMDKIRGLVLGSNLSSIRFHQKLGFVQENRELIKGKRESPVDVITFALTREDWLANKKGLEGA